MRFSGHELLAQTAQLACSWGLGRRCTMGICEALVEALKYNYIQVNPRLTPSSFSSDFPPDSKTTTLRGHSAALGHKTWLLGATIFSWMLEKLVCGFV
jgi:hypothetical protein